MKRFVIKSVDLCTDTSVKKVRNTLSLKYENVDDPTTVQHANENTNTESADEQLLCKMSYLFDGELYKIVTLDGIKVSAKCTTCSKVINGHTTSTGNFLSHIKLKHSFMMSKVQAKKDAKKKRANDELSTNNLKQSKLSFNQSEITKKKT
ncbi:protein stand still-like [Melanaphis sacchari]|uniref:protein stand still-like n=1 Tax=Melanaphis sacchari TaxID=742174 RepID=UPI000DC14368|nr:protein stand still-like [Melanaphis sacchari]